MAGIPVDLRQVLSLTALGVPAESISFRYVHGGTHTGQTNACTCACESLRRDCRPGVVARAKVSHD
jgi:hypothetical protein